MATFRVTSGTLTGEVVNIPSDAHPEHPIYNPPGIWGPTDPRPTPPIVIPPDAISPGVPTHPIYIPVYPAHPIVIPPGAIGPGVPTHPIVLPPYEPAHPIVIPPGAIDGAHPEHPIVLPPPLSIWGPPTMPPGFWGGGMGPGVKPQPPTGGIGGGNPQDGKWVYSAIYGWVWDPGSGGKPQPLPPAEQQTTKK